MTTDEQRADQMRTKTDEDQEPPVTTPPPGESDKRLAEENDTTDEIGAPVEQGDEAP